MQSADSKLVNDVVDRLKKQGLFDKFRKECMADVDTKPAYQNLTHRVQAAVEQFLSSQKWHPDLNKNQLRESLRRHLNDLHMLSTGVDRVVDQVISPKIYKDFKPQIDRVVCEHLGIDYDQWNAKQNARWNPPPSTPVPPGVNLPGPSYIPSLLDMRLDAPIRGAFPHGLRDLAPGLPPTMPPPNLPPNLQPPPRHLAVPPPGLLPPNIPVGMLPPQRGSVGSVPPLPPSAGSSIPTVLGPPPSLSLAPPPHLPPPFPDINMMTSVPPPTMSHMNINEVPIMNMNEPPPRMQYPPPSVGPSFGVNPFESQSRFYNSYPDQNFLPPQTSTFPGLPAGLPPGSFPFGAPPPPVSIVGTSGIPGIVHGTNIALQPSTELKLPIPEAPASTGPPPMTKTARDREAREKKRKLKMEPQMVDVPSAKSNDEKKSEDTGIADVTAADYLASAIVKTESVMAVDLVDDSSSCGIKTEATAADESKMAASDNRSEVIAEEPVKSYHFAWDDIDADKMSDITVSSVHTSDLSSFDEEADPGLPSDSSDNEESTADTEQNKLAADMEVQSSTVEELEKSAEKMPAGTLQANITPAASSGGSCGPQQRKPKKLIALEYNYGDSDNEETREERKARLASEKEERYLRRQQRRAELELKRKERVQNKEVDTVKTQVTKKEPRAKEVVNKVEEVKEDLTEIVAEKPVEHDVEEQQSASVTPIASESSSTLLSTPSKETESPDKNATPGSKQRRTKAQLKEELRERKMQEKQRELRRQRTRNRKYLSDDFTSIFTEKKGLLAGDSGYEKEEVSESAGVGIAGEEIIESGVEQTVEIEAVENVVAECVEVGSSSSSESENESAHVDSRVMSPYSDISNSSVYSISSESSSSAEAYALQSARAKSSRSKLDYQDERTQSSSEGRYGDKVRRLSPQPYGSAGKTRPEAARGSGKLRCDSSYERTRGREEELPYSTSRARGESPSFSGAKMRPAPYASQSATRLREDTGQDWQKQDVPGSRGKTRDGSPTPWSSTKMRLDSPQEATRQQHQHRRSHKHHHRSSHHNLQQQQHYSPGNMTAASTGSYSPGGSKVSLSGSHHELSSLTASPPRIRQPTGYRTRSPDDGRHDAAVNWTIDSDDDNSMEQRTRSEMLEYDDTTRRSSQQFDTEEIEISKHRRPPSPTPSTSRTYLGESDIPGGVSSGPRAHGAIVRQPGGWRSSSRRSTASPAYNTYFSSYVSYNTQHSTSPAYHSASHGQSSESSPRYLDMSRSRAVPGEAEWGRTPSQSQGDSIVGSSPGGTWLGRSVFTGSPKSHPLPAPPKPRRSMSPGERSNSSSSRSPSRDYMEHPQPTKRSPRHSSPGYPHVFHPEAGGRGPGDISMKRRHDRASGGPGMPGFGADGAPRPPDISGEDSDKMGRTRASQRRTEQENAPIAKRLRR